MKEDRKVSGDYTVVTGGAHSESVPSLVSDCRLMLLYARKNGMILPKALLREISWLDGVMKARSKDSVSGIDPALITEVPGDVPLFRADDLTSAVSPNGMSEVTTSPATKTTPEIEPTPSSSAVTRPVDPAPASPPGPTLPDPSVATGTSAAASQGATQGANTKPWPDAPAPVAQPLPAAGSPPDAPLPDPPATTSAGDALAPVVEPSAIAPASPSDTAVPDPSVTKGVGAAASQDAQQGDASTESPPDSLAPIVEPQLAPAPPPDATLPDPSVTTGSNAASSQKAAQGASDKIPNQGEQSEPDTSIPLPSTATTATALTANTKPGLNPEEAILDIHSQLSVLIAPTTALSLQTSEPPPGQYRIFGGMPALVKVVIIVATVSALGFVVSAGVIATNASNAKQTAEPASAPRPAVKVGDAISEPTTKDNNPIKTVPGAAPTASNPAAETASQPAAASSVRQKQPEDGSKAKS